MGWIGLVLALLAAAGKAKQQHDVNSARDKILAQQQELNAESERKARAALSQNLDAIGADSGKDEANATSADYLAQLNAALGGTPARPDLSSAAARSRQGEREAENADDAKTLADIFGTIDAAHTQRQRENIGTARTGQEIGLLGLLARNRMANAKTRMGMIQPNPWLSMLLGAMGSYGSGLATRSALSSGPSLADMLRKRQAADIGTRALQAMQGGSIIG